MELLRGHQPWLGWLGLLLAAGAPTFFFARVYLLPAARTARHPVGISAFCGLGVAITMASSWRFGEAAENALLWGGLCLVGWFIYLRWYSEFPGRRSPVLVPGRELPDFNLENLSGEIVKSSQLLGKIHILVFYRGNWCPFCTAQVGELAAQYRRLSELGAEIVLISSQPQHHIAQLARRFDTPLRFLRDPGNAAARKLNIDAPWGTPMGMQAFGYSSDTVLPTVIITDATGRIIWVDETDNYRRRPEPKTYIEILEPLKTFRVMS